MELIRRVDGSLGWYLTSKLPIGEADGAARGPCGLVSVSRDLGAPVASDNVMASLVKVANQGGS